LKWDFTRNLSLTTALFRVERGLFTSVDPNNVSQVITIPGSVTDGFEVQITGQLTDAWAMNAGYSYLDSTIDGGGFDGNRTLQTPEHMLSIWNEYQATDQLALALGVTYQDSYFVREDNAVLKCLTTPALTQRCSMTCQIRRVCSSISRTCSMKSISPTRIPTTISRPASR
jgi:catecholate siderophore receptor